MVDNWFVKESRLDKVIEWKLLIGKKIDTKELSINKEIRAIEDKKNRINKIIEIIKRLKRNKADK